MQSRRLAAKTIEASHELEWPAMVDLTVIAIFAPLFAFQATDMAYALFFQGDWSTATRWYGMRWAPKGDILFMIGAGGLCSLLGKRGLTLGLIGGVVASVILTNFRGTYIRPGTFDKFSQSHWAWLWLGMGALAVGCLVGSLPTVKSGFRNLSLTLVGTFLVIATLIVSLVEWGLARANVVDSVFAPTRHLALLALSLAAIVAQLSVFANRSQGR